MNKKIVLLLLVIGIILTGVVGLSYAYWASTHIGNNNLLQSGCFKLELSDEENDINLQKTYPLTNEEGTELIPYTFKLKNTCTTSASYEVNLEVLSSTTLDSNFVRLSLNDYESKLLNEYDLMSTTIINDAKEGRILDSGVLAPDNSKNYSLRIWLDGNTPATSEAINKVFSSKITITGNPIEEKNFKLYLDPDGGNVTETSKIVTTGSRVGYLPIPEKEGYSFSHWYKNTEDNKVTSMSIFEGRKDETIKAKWVSNNETILLKEYVFQNYNVGNAWIEKFIPYKGIPSEDTLANATIISDETSLVPAYAWIDENTMYYYANAPLVLMQNDKFANVATNATEFDISGFTTYKITSMEDMFAFTEWADGLKILDLSNFDTSNVTTMRNMIWAECLEHIDVSSFDTSNVTDMSYMFNYLPDLKELDVSHFNTSKVTDMSGMFTSCEKIKNIDVSNFDTSKVTKMAGMFNGDRKLEELNVSNFDTSNVTNMSGIFCDCQTITSIDLSNFDTSNVTNMGAFFGGCRNLTYFGISNFDTSKVTDMSDMFNDCWSLTFIDLTIFNTSNVRSMRRMFGTCKNLSTINLTSFDTSNVTDMSYMFQLSGIETLNLSNFNTSNVTNMWNMFYYCEKLNNLNISSFNTINVTNMIGMFEHCSALTTINLTSFDTSNITTMEHMFSDCTSLESLDLSSFTVKVNTKIYDIFRRNTNLTNVTLNCTNASSLNTYITNNYSNISVSCI